MCGILGYFGPDSFSERIHELIARTSSQPSRLIEEVVKRFGEHSVSTTCDSPNYSARRDFEFEELRQRLFAGIDKKAALLGHCLNMDEWDFSLVCFRNRIVLAINFGTLWTRVIHVYDSGAVESLKASIKDGYAAIDTACGWVWNCSMRMGSQWLDRSLGSARLGSVTGLPRVQRTGSHWVGGLVLARTILARNI